MLTVGGFLFGSGKVAWAATTSTTLTVTNSSGVAATTVSSGSVVTLTATVAAGSTPLTVGQVNFCDAAAAYCLDNHLLGMAQITSAGKATLRFIPGLGSHSYKAVFLGTTANQKSSSATTILSVTATASPTVTTLATSGTAGNYTLTSTVVGSRLQLTPSGTVTFLDATNGNYSLASQTLGAGVAGFTLTPLSSPVAPSGFFPLVTADFNGDGRPDILDQGTVLLGQSDGSFLTVASGQGSVAAVGDFNGDGKPDLVGAAGLGGYTVRLGNGDGTFTPLPSGSFSIAFGAAAVGDFNGDGIADLAVVEDSGSQSRVLLGNGDGTFTSGPSFPANRHSTSVIVADFNRDGKSDIAVGPSAATVGVFDILLGNGDGSFTSAPSVSPFGNYVVAGDFNGDGLTDLATINYNTGGQSLAVYLSNGDGTFTVKNTNTTIGPNQLAAGDFDGDGKLDLAVTNSQSANTVTIFVGNGDGTFTMGAGTNTGNSTSPIVTADFNGDGQPDFAIGNYTVNQLTVLSTNITESATATLNAVSVVGNGSHQISASYAGDGGFSTSSSAAASLTAQMVTPVVTIVANPSTSTYGQQVVLSATISPVTVQNHTTTGQTVVFYSGGTLLGPAILNSGVATLNITSIPAGTANLTAVYRGDANFVTATSSPLSFTVTGTVPTINFAVANHTFGDAAFAIEATSNSQGALSYTVVSGPASISGSTVTLTGAGTVVLQANQAAAGAYNAGVQQASFTVGVAAQTITFSTLTSPVTFGVAPIKLAATASSGLPVSLTVVSGPATVSGSSLSITGVGTVVVAANQVGSVNYAAAPQVTQMVVVSAATPMVSFAQPTAITYGTGLGGVLTASATSTGGSVPGSFAYKTGSMSLTASTILGAGSYPLVATFTPTDSSRYNSATASVTLAINKATATVALVSGSNPGQVQNAVPLTATVSSAVSTPTGTVAFFDGGAMIGSASLANGIATLSIALSAGSHSVTAMYGGDVNFGSLTSSALVESVQDFNLATSGTTPSQTVSGGSIANYTLSISPVNGSTFPAVVTFTASGLPTGATATFTPQTIAAGSGTTSVALAIQTVKLTSLMERGRDVRGRMVSLAFAMLLPMFWGGRRSRGRIGGVLCLLLLGVCTVGLGGCGGGSSSSTPPTTTTTPNPQTSTVTVTATSGQLSHSTTVTLTVQ